MRPTKWLMNPPTSGGASMKIPIGKPELSGLTLATLKKHYGVAPIFLMAATGLTFGVLAIIHTLKGPDIELKRDYNPEPWNEFRDKQFKLLAVGRDYNQPSPVPKY